VLFGISGISRLPAIRDPEQLDCELTEKNAEESDVASHVAVLGPMQDFETMARACEAALAFNGTFMAETCNEQTCQSESGFTSQLVSQTECSEAACEPDADHAVDEPDRHVATKPALPAASPVRSVKGTSWADLYDREEEADDISSTCDSRSDHLGSQVDTQPLSEPNSPRSSCAFQHVASQSFLIDNEDVDSQCCRVERCDSNSVGTVHTPSIETIVEGEEQPQPQSADSAEGHEEVVMPELASELPSLSIEVPAKVEAVAQRSKSQLKKQRKAALKATQKLSAVVDAGAPESEDNIKLSRSEQSTVHQKPPKQQKQGQKQHQRTMGPEVKSSDLPQASVETRCGYSMCRAVLGWLRLFMRVAQRYPVSTVLAVTMLGYSGMLMPGLGHASQPQLRQPGDESLIASRTLYPQKKSKPLGDADASPKLKTKSGKSTRKTLPKYPRHEM